MSEPSCSRYNSLQIKLAIWSQCCMAGLFEPVAVLVFRGSRQFFQVLPAPTSTCSCGNKDPPEKNQICGTQIALVAFEPSFLKPNGKWLGSGCNESVLSGCQSCFERPISTSSFPELLPDTKVIAYQISRKLVLNI